MRKSLDDQRTAELAYQLWEKEGRPAGRDLEHWQQAEKQLEVEFRPGFPDGGATADDGGDEATRALSPQAQPADSTDRANSASGHAATSR